ncbi:CitMHS family transporter [Niveispirillum sp. KHB5.9]|uniref:CitMHS family transporter n=1 Tax=Niveispirillum sp. KHB5.9 TaxID=3400269 RepID=UPI003A8B0AA5
MSQSLLAILGFGMVVVFMALIMGKRASAMVALIAVPIVVAVCSGFGGQIGGMIMKGVIALAPIAVVLLFAVLYFGIMIDAGLFDPMVRRVIDAVGADPRRVTIGTALVAIVVSLDGDGATTALVTITAFLPVYRRLGMNPLILATLLGAANSIINIAPWGGPMPRVASVLRVPINDLFLPLIPVMVSGCIGVLILAWYLGGKERRRLGPTANLPSAAGFNGLREGADDLARPKLFWANLILTLAVIAAAVAHIVPMPVIFMIGLVVALTLNYPEIGIQRLRIAAHSANVLPIILLVFAAAVFTGILEGTGMVKAMGASFVDVVPPSMGRHLALIMAVASGPLTFVMSNDAYYFGIVPVIAEAASHYGITAAEIGRASLLGQNLHALSPLVAAVYLVAGMLDVDVGAMQRFALKWAAALAALLVATAVLTGAIPISASGRPLPLIQGSSSE